MSEAQRSTELGDARLREFSVEIVWPDWKKAGAKGPTSIYGGFDTSEKLESFIEQMLSTTDVVRMRRIEREVVTPPPWEPVEDWIEVTADMREKATDSRYRTLFPHLFPPADTTSQAPGERP